jgi:hypothetical protein
MSDTTRLCGKIFAFSLPSQDNNPNACKLLVDDEMFMDKVLEIKGCKEVQSANVCGVYVITFDAEDCPYMDNEIIRKIDTIANNIGFTTESDKYF